MDWNLLLSCQRKKGVKQVFRNGGRSPFEQDFDRVVFSHPFRRLQDKTQVHPLPVQDFVHTRLTHSLEVSSVGRSLGKLVGEKVLHDDKALSRNFSPHDFASIVSTASLAHDIGNPPFGHTGEDAISEFFKKDGQKKYKHLLTEDQWSDLINFEGNAQGFRILNHSGMKLTYATMATFCKYPTLSLNTNHHFDNRRYKKYGVFQTEIRELQEIVAQVGLIEIDTNTWARHPLTYLVEAADDICYILIDLEDGCRLGLISFEQTLNLFKSILKDKFNQEKLEKNRSNDEKIGVLRAMAVGLLVDECVDVFYHNLDKIMVGEYTSSLVKDIQNAKILEDVLEVSVQKIYHAKNVIVTESAGYEVLPGLLDVFSEVGINLFQNDKISNKIKKLSTLFPSEYLYDIQQTKSIYDVLRSCIDFVSGLTDRGAIHIYRQLKGISLPNT